MNISSEDVKSVSKQAAGVGLYVLGGTSIAASYVLTGVTILGALGQGRLPSGSEIRGGWDSALEPIGEKMMKTGEDWVNGN